MELAQNLPKRLDQVLLWLGHDGKTIGINLTLIMTGSLICVIGINALIIPFNFLSGGIVGMSILTHYLVPSLPMGWIYLLFNIPLALIGWRHISHRFMIYSVIGMVFFSAAAATIQPPVPVLRDPMLAALFAGVICGTGAGLILRSVGSAGGFDILVIYLNKRFGFRIGAVIFLLNAAILAAGGFIYDLEMLLYSIVCLYSSSRTADAIISGFNQRKSLMVISDHADAIARTILADKGRGVTFLNGEGAFTGAPKKVIFTITGITELSKMKALIWQEDPNAFMVVNDTMEVLGKRHGRGRVY